MCTLSVFRLNSHCLITMNRDDLIDRPEAPPKPPGVSPNEIIAPRDLQAGGTWIGLNQFGLVGCLLNRYDQSAPANARSRGRIIPEALQQAVRVDEAAAQIANLELDTYAPFTCVILSRGDAVRLDWTGASFLSEVIPNLPSWMITSSSISEPDVRAKRSHLFDETLTSGDPSADKLAQFHAQSSEVDAWWSPWMARPLAHTKSITQVLLEPNTSQMRYWDRQAVIENGLVAAPYVVTLNRAINHALA
jgi:Transport and Golgi organisation 2